MTRLDQTTKASSLGETGAVQEAIRPGPAPGGQSPERRTAHFPRGEPESSGTKGALGRQAGKGPPGRGVGRLRILLQCGCQHIQDKVQCWRERLEKDQAELTRARTEWKWQPCNKDSPTMAASSKCV